MTLARRLLPAARGGGGFPRPRSVRALVAAPDGFWQNITDARAFYYNNVTYFAWLNGQSGDVKVASYDHLTSTVSTPFTLRSAWGPDIHKSPSLIVRSSDHRIVVAYAGHESSSIKVRISTNPEDVTAFDAEFDALPASNYTYASLVQLNGESGAPIYLFSRSRSALGAKGRLTRYTSTDGGATFGSGVIVMEPASGSQTPYWNIGTDWDTRVDVFTTDTDRDVSTPSSLYHFSIVGDVAHASDGTTIEALASWPFDPSAATLISDPASSPTGPRSALGACFDGTSPATAYKVWDGTENLIYVARWDGAAWQIDHVADTAGVIGGNEFIGSGIIHRTNPDVVYFPRIVSGRAEMFRYESADSGATWTGTQLTTGSSEDNAMPGAVINGSGIEVIWGLGTYTSDSDYAFGVTGYG